MPIRALPPCVHVRPDFPCRSILLHIRRIGPLLLKKRSVWTARKRMEVALELESREGIVAPEEIQENPHPITQAVSPSLEYVRPS